MHLVTLLIIFAKETGCFQQVDKVAVNITARLVSDIFQRQCLIFSTLDSPGEHFL